MRQLLEGHAIAVQMLAGSGQSRERCFRRIWQQYYARLLVFVRAQGVAAEAEAEDLVQDVMEKIFRGICTYDPSRSFSTWVYCIARNACRDRARRERARPPARFLSDLPADGEPFHTRTPERELLRREADAGVEEFFRSAQPQDRQIAFLRFCERMRCAEIASVMDMPVGTVKFRIHEMRRKLRTCMEAANG